MDNKKNKRKVELAKANLQQIEEEIARDAEQLKCQYDKISAHLDLMNQKNYEMQDQALWLMDTAREGLRVPGASTQAQDELLELDL